MYFKKFEAKGRLKRHIVYAMLAIVMLSQLLNFAFFKVISGGEYILGVGVVLVCLQTGALIGFKISQHWSKKRLNQ